MTRLNYRRQNLSDPRGSYMVQMIQENQGLKLRDAPSVWRQSLSRKNYARKLDEAQGRAVCCQRGGLDLAQQPVLGAESTPPRAAGTQEAWPHSTAFCCWSAPEEEIRGRGSSLGHRHTAEDVC